MPGHILMSGNNLKIARRAIQDRASIVLFIAINSILIINCSNPDKLNKPENNISTTDTIIKKVDSITVNDFANKEMKKAGVPGMSIAVVRRGSIIFKNCYGLANLELSIPVTPESPFKIASLTKPFTATAIMQLVEKDEISLDQKISFYLEDLPEAWNSISVRQLLCHSSGLSDYFQAPDWSWRNSWRLDLTHEEFIRMIRKSPMLFKPGEKIQYCNAGYYLLGMLIEKVSGKRYEEYLNEHIFKPLEMSNSRLDHAQLIIPNRVSGYTWERGEWRNAEFTSDTWAYSEGGIVTTAEDLAKFDSSFYTEKLLKKASLEQMWSHSKLSNGNEGIIGDNGAGKPNYYGLGWFISDYKNHKLILAGGNKPGYTCTFFRFTEDDLTIIILSNLSSAPLYGIAGEIAEMYLAK